MTLNVGIVIPCYRSKGLINNVVDRILFISEKLKNDFYLKIFIVDDFCPEKSWEDVKKDPSIEVIHHSNNLGVGEASMTGFRKAMEDGCQIIIKMDSDGQHNPDYLEELINYIANLPKYTLVMIKGTRYFYPTITKNVPFLRKLGSILLEPIVRMAISYRKLTDVTNGFLAFNLITLKTLTSPKIGSKLKSRYLFESSILAKCSEIECEIHEFAMLAKYSKRIKSSFKSYDMIIPLCSFWSKEIVKRIFNKYVFTLNLGSLLLCINFLTLFYALILFINRIYSDLSANLFVSAGTSASFTSSITISVLAFCMFLFYDYFSGKNVKKIKFLALVNELEKLN